MDDWQTLSRRTILDQSRFLVVESHTVRLPDGQVIEDWPWVITPDFVTADGRYLCFRQPKYAIEGLSLAPVGGYIDSDEAPLAAAQRELVEETGYEASAWCHLGTFPVDGNRGAGKAHLYLAQDARRIAEPDADDLEDQEMVELTREKMSEALDRGEFKVLPWATAVALALRAT
ncbi:MAG: NUDIX hydrolase [Anaerolineae bacterium]